MPPLLHIAGHTLDLAQRPLIMGVINVTPDSFSDGGACLAPEDAASAAEALVAAGADILDIGGESARPGAAPVSETEEIARVVPAIAAIRARVRAPLSIDTRRAATAEAALGAGAGMINDVSALRHDPGLAGVAARAGVPLCLMHSRGTPADMRSHARYEDIAGEVITELREAVAVARRAGVMDTNIVLDPGIGFAKTAAQSFALLHELPRLVELGYPVLLGVSRKSFLDAAAPEPVAARRAFHTAAAVAIGVFLGAHIVRVHDALEMKPVVAIATAARRKGLPDG